MGEEGRWREAVAARCSVVIMGDGTDAGFRVLCSLVKLPLLGWGYGPGSHQQAPLLSEGMKGEPLHFLFPRAGARGTPIRQDEYPTMRLRSHRCKLGATLPPPPPVDP